MLSLSFARRLAVMCVLACAVAPALAQTNVSLEAQGTVLGIQERPFFKDTRKGRVTLVQSTVLVWLPDIANVVSGRVIAVEMEPGHAPRVQRGDVVCTSWNGEARIVQDEMCSPLTPAGGVS